MCKIIRNNSTPTVHSKHPLQETTDKSITMTIVYALISREKTVLTEHSAASGKQASNGLRKKAFRVDYCVSLLELLSVQNFPQLPPYPRTCRKGVSSGTETVAVASVFCCSSAWDFGANSVKSSSESLMPRRLPCRPSPLVCYQYWVQTTQLPHTKIIVSVLFYYLQSLTIVFSSCFCFVGRVIPRCSHW